MESTDSLPRAWRASARGVCIAGVCLVIAACASTQPRAYYSYGAGDESPDAPNSPNSYITELALDVQQLACEARRESYPQAQCSGHPLGNDPGKTVSPAASPDPVIRLGGVAVSGSVPTPVAGSSKSAEFLQAGMALSDLLCLDHFRQASSNQRHREYGRNVLNGTNGLVSTILGLTKTGSLATGIVGAGFSFAGSTAEGIESAYMGSVDMGSAQSLVQRTMETLADHYTTKPPANYYAAERALVRYATTCTFSGVRALLSQTVRGAVPNVDLVGPEPLSGAELTRLRGLLDSTQKKP